MMTFVEQLAILKEQGYRLAAAQAKVAHDTILLAMHRCGFRKSGTIKGGVVMSHITGDVRRTTMDMDIAFIRRSISEPAVRKFVKDLNCIPGVKIMIFGTVTELLQDDYHGKRVYLQVTDGSIKAPLLTKIDIGVHTHSEVKQIQYFFHLTDENEARLQINSCEQIFVEKLLSLLRFQFLSTRPKDVFDMYYLCDKLDTQRLGAYMQVLVYGNRKCRCRSKDQVLNVLKATFSSRAFMRKLSTSSANWLEIDPQVAVTRLMAFLRQV